MDDAPPLASAVSLYWKGDELTHLPACDIDAVAGELWDVAVIGAGPAGALAARQLANRGHRVVLIERRQFPRYKVCGACVNRRAQSVLESVGLSDKLMSESAVPTRKFRLRTDRREIVLPLKGMTAISRSRLDTYLVGEAVGAGVSWLPGVEARVLPRRANGMVGAGVRWSVGLREGTCNAAELAARSLVIADGLGGGALRECGGWTEHVSVAARVGMGACFESCHSFYEPGVLYMGVSRCGYIGVVRTGDAELNLAAAVDPRWLKEVGGAGRAAVELLEGARLPVPDELPAAAWKGTPRLTHRVRPVAGDAVFLLGDAAEYVEPFTGEGIAAALTCGTEIVPHVEVALAGGVAEAAATWCRDHRRLVTRSGRWCRRLAWILRRPRLARWSASAVAAFPALSRPILRHLQRKVIHREAGWR